MSRKPAGNVERLRIATDVASKITDALYDVGYSELALQEIFDILVTGLVEQDEESFSDLLEQMGIIYGNEAEDDTDGDDNGGTYVN